MTSSPHVSVVIPTRDRVDMLARALRSVLEQEEVDLEAIVVDDGSSDGTAEWLRAHDDARVVVISHDRSQGVARSRNDAVALARGHWVAFLDDDDLWAPRKLRAQLALADADVALVYCGVVFVEESGGVLFARVPPSSDDLGPALRTWNVVGGPSSVLARTDLVRDVGAFDERFSVFADWDLWLRLARHGRVVGAPEPLVAYLLHASNMHAGDTGPLVRELDELRAKHSEIELDRAMYARWLAGGQRRSGRRASAARTYAASGLRDRSPGNLVRAATSLVPERALRALRRSVERPDAADYPWVARLLR